MPSTETIYQLFLASPDDLAAERARTSEVVDHLNHIWRSRGVQIRLLRWETDSHPSVGQDGQDVINNQIPINYEIFVGMMWARFGSPTGRADSGTAEELQRALERHKQSGSPRILFYFRVGPLPIADIDGEQLAKVQAFKRALRQLGILYFNYDSPDDLSSFLLVHLNDVLEELQHAVDQPARTSPDVKPVPDKPVEHELQLQRLRADLAMLHTGTFEEREQFSAIFATLSRFEADFESLRVTILDPAFPKGAEREPKLQAAAVEAMTRLAVTLEERIPRLVSIQARNLDRLSDLLVRARHYPEFAEALTSYTELSAQFSRNNTGIYTSTSGIRQLVDSCPPTTAEVTVVKRRCQDAFDSLNRQLALVAHLSTALETPVGEKPANPRSD